jgi:hypothetical protein
VFFSKNLVENCVYHRTLPYPNVDNVRKLPTFDQHFLAEIPDENAIFSNYVMLYDAAHKNP